MGLAAGLKIVKLTGVVRQKLSSDGIRDIIAPLEIPCGPFRTIGVWIIGRIHEEIFPHFFYHATEKGFITLTAEKDPARFQIVARRVANEVPRMIRSM